jgi:hypothetical protein
MGVNPAFPTTLLPFLLLSGLIDGGTCEPSACPLLRPSPPINMGFFLLSLLSSTLVATTVNALGWTSTPFNPASIPLAVRTPYLSTWLPQGSGHALNAQWPSFWTNSIAAWAGYVKVDNVAYTFMGTPDVPNVKSQPAVQKSFTFTSTQSMFVMSAGGVDLNITFLSPIEVCVLVLTVGNTRSAD